MGVAAVVACSKLVSSPDDTPAPKPVAGARTKEHAPATALSAPAAPEPAAVAQPTPEPKPLASHPFAGLSMHVVGGVKVRDHIQHHFVIAQAGIPVQELSTAQVIDAGYTVDAVSYCVARVSYPGIDPFFARCDLPRTGIDVPGPG